MNDIRKINFVQQVRFNAYNWQSTEQLPRWFLMIFVLEKDRSPVQLVGISVRWILSVTATSIFGKVDSRPSDFMMSYNCAMVGCSACVCCWFWLIWCLKCNAIETRSSADADNRLDAFSGQSRSTDMVPFHMLHIVSYCAIVTLSLRPAVFTIFIFKKFHDLEMGVKGHSRSLWVVSFDRLCMVSY